LCRSFIGNSFGVAPERICRRCFLSLGSSATKHTPNTRVKLSHDLPRVQPWAQQGAPPRPTSGLGLSLGLGRRSPPRPTPGLDLSLGLGKSHNLARPQPRPQEKTPPRSTSASASGEVSATPGLSLGPTTLQGIHHYSTPS
jgi:hypothetical protein